MPKFTRAVVAVLSLLLVAGPLALSAHTAEVRLCPNVLVRDVWATIAAPAFTAGGPELTDYVVHPRKPSMILVTNGEQVFVSPNGGCDWQPYDFSLELLPTANRPVSNATSRIVDLDIPEHPSGAGTVYITVEEGLRGAAVRPHVFVNKGQESQWRSAIHGLPPVAGRVWGLHVAPSNPNVLYLHVKEDAASFRDDIYASLDAGTTWQKRSDGDDGFGSTALAVDPLMADHLWTWGPGGLWHSVDGGRSRSNINSVASVISHVDVFHAPGAPARIMAYEPETLSFAISRDGGATWDYIMGPGGQGLSIAHGNKAEDVVFSQHLRVDRFKEPRFWLDITPDYKQPDLQELSADRTPTPSIFGMTPRTIERYTGLNEEIELPGFVDPLNPVDLDDRTSLQPANTTVALKPGGSKKVQYQFALPANPTPLDVFFLVDTTSSMDSAIDGLRVGMQRIANDLAASKIDVQFGVGEVKDYPVPGYGSPHQGDFPYKLRREIGPVTGLDEGLEQLEASGGGSGDYEEAQLTGLYEAMTGEGEPGCAADPGVDVRACVPPGQGANFRPHALPVIVHITDYAFHDEPSHPSPPFDRVAQELSLQGAKQIGVAVWGPPNGWHRATEDLQAMAEATDTLAPEGGVDCDADGSTDISAGQPLVCQLSDMDGSGSLNIAPPIIATVKAVAEEVSVELVTTDAEVIDVDRNLYPSVDITERNSLGFGVTFSCPPALAGTKHNLTLAAHVQGQPVATAAAKVECKGVPPALVAKRRQNREEPPPPLPPVLPVFPPAAVAIPIVVPAGPPPVPETITSTQSAAQAQGAIAKQEQEQVQVAVAIAQFKNEEAYALSSYTERRDHPPPLPLYLSAVLMSLAAGFFTLTRARVRTSVSRRRY